MMIYLCIGNAIGWLVYLYGKQGRLGLIGNIAIGTIGAFGAGILTSELIPTSGFIGAVVLATLGSLFLTLVVRRYQHRIFAMRRH